MNVRSLESLDFHGKKVLLRCDLNVPIKEGIIKDGNDHLLDAMRYAVMSGLKIAKPQKDLYDYYQPHREPGFL